MMMMRVTMMMRVMMMMMMVRMTMWVEYPLSQVYITSLRGGDDGDGQEQLAWPTTSMRR